MAEKALTSARHMNNAPEESKYRMDFFEELKHNSFEKCWETYIKEKKKSFLGRLARAIIRRLKYYGRLSKHEGL